MPELPEVETVARTLAPRLVGRRVMAIETSGKRLRRPIDLAALERALVGARVDAVERVAKYLLVSVASGNTLLVHLGMSGRLMFAEAKAARAPHTHVVMTLDDGAELRYVDPRRFGVVLTHPTATRDQLAELRVLGPDPLSTAFSSEYLRTALKRSKRDLKAFLMDQGQVAGLGNIYVCEALFVAGLSPRRRAHRVTQVEGDRLRVVIREILASAIAHRGTSLSDYVDAEGRIGDNQAHLRVYGRTGERCLRCGARVKRLVQGARSTFYCGKCQK